jgi:uncharacterized membrane protein YedE/YeeE
MKLAITTFFSGILFAVGLSISGMTMPSKVIGFLDVAGNWDISLMFVMMGAIGVYAFVFHLIKPKMSKPFFAEEFKLPTRTEIDFPLVVGAAFFGAGWGLGGFCPGPVLASASSLNTAVLIFIATMIAGMYLGMILQLFVPKALYRNK